MKSLFFVAALSEDYYLAWFDDIFPLKKIETRIGSPNFLGENYQRKSSIFYSF